MKCKNDKVIKSVSLLLDDARRPGAVFDLNGMILYENRSFSEHGMLKEITNIKKFMMKQSIDLWDAIVNSDDSANNTCKIDLPYGEEQNVPVHVDIIYVEHVKQVIALFDIPKKEPEVAKKTYLHAFHNAICLMLVVNREGIICDVNNQYTKFFNVNKDYFLGKTVDVVLQLFPNYSESTLKQYIQNVKHYGCAEETLKYQPPYGEERYYHVATIYNSETNMYLIRMNDLTEKMALEQQLVHTGSLSTVGELAASIAHEIRNPMTTLKGFVQLLQISASEDTLKYLAVIDDEISRMESILGEMLVLSKPASNKKTTFSLEVLVDDMIQVMRPKAMMDGITINRKETDLGDTLVNGDAEKIKQVLLNLFKNAVEAMSSGGTLTISITLDKANQLRLDITDTGKGMTRQQLNQIFMPFYTSKPEGTGLGLPFVLKTIEEHGGTVTVESEVNQGTVFIVTFPPAIIPSTQKGKEEERLLLY
ncbi:ATP-binding protein [Sporosarcina sp. ACRSM]|uniref:ATP-binding protein n=1 Tax=Sporosarcina sp. ACRSM TaxID=2918216 RepID=UPI001EF57127|nr:ATP-binding protein [Sporosarcina sp. ACRSM]MCG7334243.1 ATP-binding protein [Sporosarcina sp. ACRSM]